MAVNEATRAAYDRRVQALIRAGDKLQLKDLRRIQASFDTFTRRAIQAIQTERGFALSRAIQQTTLNALAVEIDALGASLGGIFADGVGGQADLARELRVAFGSSFLPEQLEQVLGVSQTARAVALTTRFSADLIDGITDRVRREINGIVGRAALGVAGQTAFDSVTEIQKALRGDAVRRWRHHAERIYRTETLRVHSILTDQTVRDFNTRIPTSKRWAWSGISRREHASINGQVRSARSRFLVPIKEGGSVKLRFPRDPGGPPSAVINCGCFLVPIPTSATKPAGASRRRSRRPRVSKPKTKKPLSPAQRITAAKKELTGLGTTRPLAQKVVLRGIKGSEAADALERLVAEVARLRARFPAFANGKAIRELRVARRSRGFWSDNRIMQVGVQRHKPVPTTLTDDAGNAIRAQLTAVEDMEGVFRHEYGHLIDTDNRLSAAGLRIGNAKLNRATTAFHGDVELAFEWEALLEKYPTRALKKTDGGGFIYDRTPGESYPGSAKSWWTQNIDSQYVSSHYAWDSATTGGTEAWAELVQWVTRPEYVQGSLPADLEGFVLKVLNIGG